MRRLSLFAAAAASLAFAAPAMAEGSPVAGTWVVEAKTDFGNFKSSWTVAEADGAYTLDMADAPMDGFDGPPPKSTITDVKVDGDTLTFKRELDMGQGAMVLTYSAKVEGNTMTGSANSDFGPIPITGTRQ